MTIYRPAPFPIPDRVPDNRATHAPGGEDGRCMFCDARVYGMAAEWPCGTRDEPRIVVGDEDDYFACFNGTASPIDPIVDAAVARAKELVR